jgi:hypothetical protein
MLLAAGLGLFGWAAWRVDAETAVQQIGNRPTATAAASPEPTPSQPPISPTPQPTGSQPEATVASTPPPATYAVPRRVRIPAIGVATRVAPMGIDENRALEVPENVELVGEYDPDNGGYQNNVVMTAIPDA